MCSVDPICQNPYNYENSELTELSATYQLTFDAEERGDMVGQFQQILYDELPGLTTIELGYAFFGNNKLVDFKYELIASESQYWSDVKLSDWKEPSIDNGTGSEINPLIVVLIAASVIIGVGIFTKLKLLK